MQQLINDRTLGLYSMLDEVSFFIKNAQHHLKQVYPGAGLPIIDGTDYAHTIIRITTKHDETFALDMAGAQYDWDGVIIPWKLYVNMRVREIREVMPFGQTKVFCKMRAEAMGAQFKWIHGIKDNFAKNMDDAITWWQRGHLPTTKLLRLPEQDFQREQASLLETVDKFLQLYKTMQDSQGAFEVKGGFKYGMHDRKFTSAALGIIPGMGPLSSGTS